MLNIAATTQKQLAHTTVTDTFANSHIPTVSVVVPTFSYLEK
ncbi:MAG: hypothetical protein AAF614_44620 [Chloroflexota bacterium]